MPYSGPKDPSLPANVRGLRSLKVRRQWIHVYDSEKAAGKSDGDAIHIANGAVARFLGHSTAKGAHDMISGTPVGGAGEVAAVIAETHGDAYLGYNVTDRQVSQQAASYQPYGATGGKGCASCLIGASSVKMATGSSKSIRSLVLGKSAEDVLSVDDFGHLVPKAITGWYRTPRNGRRLVNLRSVVQGGSGGHGDRAPNVWVTEDHPVLTPEGYVAAGSLHNDSLVVTRFQQPSPQQTAFLIGTLLGDSSFNRENPNSVALQVQHTVRNSDWMEMKALALKDYGWSYGSRVGRLAPNGRPFDAVTGLTSREPGFVPLERAFYHDGGIHIPVDLLRQYLSPELLAAWFLDDGDRIQRNSPCARLSTHAYSEGEVAEAVTVLNEYGYICSSHRVSGREGQFYILFNVDGSRRLFDAIGPYTPPSMRYKVMPDSPAFDEYAWELPSSTVMESKVLVKTGEPYAKKNKNVETVYCIDVEDNHNFVASNIVVHNCQFFISPDQCVIVSGDISPTGLSRFYEPDEDLAADAAGEDNWMQVQLVDEDGDPIDIGALLSLGSPMAAMSGTHDVWTAAYQDALPDSAFAFIDAGGKRDATNRTVPRSLRHFPYRDSSGKLDDAHVRDALGRVPQSHVSAPGKHAALVKLHAAARSLGMKLTADAGKMPMAAGSSKDSGPIGNAYKTLLGWMGLSDLSFPEGTPTSVPSPTFPAGPLFSLSEDTLTKQPGRLRYWAVASNNFYDNKGLEFPTQAQSDYVDWVWSNPQKNMAELQLWHTPGTKLGQDDWVDYDGHFLHSTGLIDVGREELARKYASDPDIGMSHGYVVVWDQHNRAIGFRSYEKSILPRQHAGNSFTSFGLEEGDMGFSEPRKNFLRQAGLSDADITARETRWEQFGSVLEGLGIGHHELELYVASGSAEAAPAADPAPAGALTAAAPAAAPSTAAAPAPAADLAMPTETLTTTGLQEMISDLVQAQVAQALHAIATPPPPTQTADEVVAAAWRARLGQHATPASASPSTIPAVTQLPDGGLQVIIPASAPAPVGAVVEQQALGAAVPVTQLDPKVLQVIAQGNQDAGAADSGPGSIGWLAKRLQGGGNPLLTGAPTEHRG